MNGVVKSMKDSMEARRSENKRNKTWRDKDFKLDTDLAGLLDLSPAWFARGRDVGVQFLTFYYPSYHRAP